MVARSPVLTGEQAAGLMAPILSAWPGTPPALRHASLPDIIESPRSLGAGGVVALLGPDEPSGIVYRLADALGSVHRPALVLYDDAPGRPAPRDNDGLLVEPRSAEPRRLACTLDALLRRQPVVDRLAGEVSLMHASLGGVQGQVSRWQDEMQLAASVQREFLPRGVPTSDGLDVGVIFRPAGYVSGDIYDVCQLDEWRTAFYIADAVGHGVPAALLTLVIARAIRKTEGVGHAMRVLEPSETLTRLNLEFCERMTDRSRFATAVYGVFDARTGIVTLAGAGHPPPLLSRRGRIERIETEGPLLGIFPEAEYPQVEFRLEPGDVLVLFSDGFETAFPDPEATGRQVRLPTLTYLDRLAEAGSGLTELTGAIDRLEAQLDAQAGSLHQPDDVTAILLAPKAVAHSCATRAA